MQKNQKEREYVLGVDQQPIKQEGEREKDSQGKRRAKHVYAGECFSICLMQRILLQLFRSPLGRVER